ncbi:DNA-3-methyladenine glycosylase 2 family protein [Skermanella rosea]|uniref:DNA-3-methyladenine glycosylase family protein n=1 Tax=Skermanella rosea TaxID=1817965 RepID=UPI00193124EF|nr:DNA-3-methyladenine glycosylase 2 family protein [Skermanella rosea]UEM06055.1 DNA-3-methyladenine glycosylase 2 family protein [Skermanella rosea]
MSPHDRAVDSLLSRDPLFRRCLEARGPLPEPVPRTPSGFPGLLRIILEQQVSTLAAEAMWRKLCAAAGTLPTPEAVLALPDDTLKACGFSRQKIDYARGLAGEVASGRLDMDLIDRLPDDEALEALVRVKGIGRWSAEIYLLLVLCRPDVWPVDDLAVALGLQWLLDREVRPPRDELLALGDPWRPYRSTAARLVWHYYLSVAPERRRRARGSPALAAEGISPK